MKTPPVDPALRELIGLSLIAGGGCGLALAQANSYSSLFWGGMRSDNYRGDATLGMKDDRRARDPRLAAIVIWANIGRSS
jgi:hypothetical protein